MKFSKFLDMLKKKQEGSVVVIVALFMTVLIGLAALVLDIGLANNSKSNLQKDMDSIALAAVRNLPANDISSQEWINAKTTAHAYALENGVTNLTDGDIIPVYEDGAITGVKITGETTVQYYFAKAFGNESKIINCEATAKLLTVMGMADFVPLSIEETYMEKALTDPDYTVKYGPHDNDDLVTNGWFGTLAMDGTGSNTYENSFKYGATRSIELGVFIPMETGNMSGSTRDGFNYRINGHEGCHVDYVDGKEVVHNSAGNICTGCPRIVTVPVVQEIDKFVDNITADLLIDHSEYTQEQIDAEITAQINLLLVDLANEGITGITESNIRNENTKLSRVTSFASVFLVSLEGNGANSIITATYLPNHVAAGSLAGVATNDYGVRAAKLIK